MEIGLFHTCMFRVKLVLDANGYSRRVREPCVFLGIVSCVRSERDAKDAALLTTSPKLETRLSASANIRNTIEEMMAIRFDGGIVTKPMSCHSLWQSSIAF